MLHMLLCKMDSWQEAAISLVLCDGLEGWGEGREVPERGDICIIMADLSCCGVETNTIL